MLSTKEHRDNKREFNHSFAEQIRKLREEKGLTLEELSKETRIQLIQLIQLMSMELGHHKDWGYILKLARFYEKKIKLEFY